MSKPPELKYRPLADGRYEVWLHAVIPQDALLGLHGVLAQYAAEGPPDPEPEDGSDESGSGESGSGGLAH
ncbi:hypothetical protein [Phenylobacterium sp.]|uniref:hypothetical protein n=1 Tax=Phenylobacterium sp. TaxID=1871053 RepID=UPI00272FE0EF|nr:hypothetical protein [Phenylobacterium sp.]MDP1618673.1 hypothetical protein [Phenylobacterium sp.]MDP1986578.1 hypothetical protein [Phenylobacterium sp.]